MLPYLIPHALMTVHFALSQGIHLTVLRSSREFHDAFVTVPLGLNLPLLDVPLLDLELADLGLELLDDDEADPEVTPEGMKIWCAFINGVEEVVLDGVC